YGGRRGQARNGPHAKNWKQRKQEGRTIVQRALGFQLRQLALFAACLQTRRAKMLAVQFHVTKSAQKPAATRAGDDGALLGVKKATRFPFHQDGFTRFALRDFSEKGGENGHLEHRVAARAGRWFALVEN